MTDRLYKGYEQHADKEWNRGRDKNPGANRDGQSRSRSRDKDKPNR